jgi:hypothetical protein
LVGPLYVRVNIIAEQDDEFEGAETFKLVATNTQLVPLLKATATITRRWNGRLLG